VDERPARVREIVSAAGLTIVQLHGGEAREDWDFEHVSLMKAVGVEDDNREAILAAWSGARVLLDAHDPKRRGGTGRTADWEAAAAIARKRDIVLAGGLRPENVAAAITRVRPWGIDVSSGVEDAPGVKNHDKLGALFAAIESAGTAPVGAAP
jgi:phosphoribosylanthranilate isomerase